MKTLILLILCNLLSIQGLRNPKEIEYREKEIFKPTLEELKTGSIYKGILENLVKNFFLFQFLKML